MYEVIFFLSCVVALLITELHAISLENKAIKKRNYLKSRIRGV